jgi:hypothetical protein
MARNGSTNSSSGTTSPNVQPPEGFQRSGTAIATGWFNMGLIGNELSGQLLGLYSRKDKLRTEGTSQFFQVQIDKECQVRIERGEDAKMAVAKPGEIVNVNFGPKTKPWADLIPDIRRGAEYAVYGKIAGSKLKLDGGRTMHAFDTFQRMVRPPTENGADVDFDGGDSGDEGAQGADEGSF